MASDEHTFDVVSKPDMQEIDNALQMAMKEITTRFDFKGSISKIETTGEKITVVSEDEFKLQNVIKIFEDKLFKRKIPLKFIQYEKMEDALGGHKKQEITIKKGIPQDIAKQINLLVKNSGLKVRSQIQGEEMRVFAKKIDDLQAIMQKIRATDYPVALQFVNYR
ncbi:MAG: YajQ family cyclic di-GMP-binding protein [Candidatus Margulisiibacteriota bacterium]